MRRSPFLGAVVSMILGSGAHFSKFEVQRPSAPPMPRHLATSDTPVRRIAPGNGRGRAKSLSAAEQKRRSRKRRNVLREKARRRR